MNKSSPKVTDLRDLKRSKIKEGVKDRASMTKRCYWISYPVNRGVRESA